MSLILLEVKTQPFVFPSSYTNWEINDVTVHTNLTNFSFPEIPFYSYPYSQVEVDSYYDYPLGHLILAKFNRVTDSVYVLREDEGDYIKNIGNHNVLVGVKYSWSDHYVNYDLAPLEALWVGNNPFIVYNDSNKFIIRISEIEAGIDKISKLEP